MNYRTWLGYGLIAGGILANFGTYVVFPLGAPIWTVLAVGGSYLAFKRGR